MKKIIFSLITLIHFGMQSQYTGQVLSSSSAGGNANSLGQLETLMGPISERASRDGDLIPNMSGSPYTSNQFQPGNVYYEDENTGKVYYRYNSYNQEIEIKQSNLKEEPIRGLGRDKKISLVSNDGKVLRFSTFIDKKGLTQNGYLTLLVEGDYALYLRNTAKFTEGQKSPNSFVKATPPKFTQFSEYYLEVKGKNRVDEVEFKNKKFLKLLPDSVRSSTEAYLKKEKIKIKDLDDLKEVLQYLNTQ